MKLSKCILLLTLLELANVQTARALEGFEDFEFWDDAGQHYRFEYLGSMFGLPPGIREQVNTSRSLISDRDLTLVFRIRLLSSSGSGAGMYRLFPRHGGSACPPFGPLLGPFGYRVIGAGWLEGEGIEPTADGFNPLLWERCPGGDYEIQWSFRERPILAGEFSRPLFLSVDPERGPGGGMWLGLYRDGPHPLSQLIGLSPFSEVCADDDLDQICNQSDPCRFTPNMNSFEDSDRDGIPNECQCGDPNQSGSYEGADLLAAHECLIEDADAERSPCAERVWKGDTDGDGRWANGDLIRIRGTLIGNQPGWALSCPARPEGTPPPRALHD